MFVSATNDLTAPTPVRAAISVRGSDNDALNSYEEFFSPTPPFMDMLSEPPHLPVDSIYLIHVVFLGEKSYRARQVMKECKTLKKRSLARRMQLIDFGAK